MNKPIYGESDWMQCLMRGEQPSDESLREHLLLVHRNHPGFAESCALKCRDSLGRNSYELLAGVMDQKRHSHILDLACGSGVLLEVCRQRCEPSSELIGVDINYTLDDTAVNVRVRFKVINTFTPIDVNLTLERTR